VNPQDIKNGNFIIKDKDEVKHLSKVFRIQKGEKIYLFDNTGKRYLGEVCEVQKFFISGKILSEIKSKEKKLYLKIFPALIKSERFQLLLEKITEIGVDEILPYFSERSVVKISSEKIQSKLSKWKKIILSSSKQSNSQKIPKLSENILKFEEAILSVDSSELNLIAWEFEDKNLLKDIIFDFLSKKPKFPLRCNLFTGPEGGFTKSEIDFAVSHGFKTFSLGKNILRAETAVIVSASLINALIN
jgi:16S rRNA (uracil1498-N3)-methyltransferase